MSRRFSLLLLALVIIISATSLPLIQAQESDLACDLDALLEHQQEHAAAIANFEAELESDPDAALENLYIAGIAYQALAVECGFLRLAEAEAIHQAEHGNEFVTANQLTLATSIGNPENGRVIFNTVQPEIGLACASCHYVDTTGQLVGPGLQGIGSLSHDPSDHAADGSHAEATTQASDAGGHDMGHMDEGGTMGPAAHDDDHGGESHPSTSTDEATAQAEAEHGHGHSEATPMAGAAHDDESNHAEGEDAAQTATTETTSQEVIDYIRTSILDPNAFIVPGFPANVMPHIYGDILTEAELNDLIAYLLTL